MSEIIWTGMGWSYLVGALPAAWWLWRRFERDRHMPAADVLPYTVAGTLGWPLVVPWLAAEARVARWVARRRGDLLQ